MEAIFRFLFLESLFSQQFLHGCPLLLYMKLFYKPITLELVHNFFLSLMFLHMNLIIYMYFSIFFCIYLFSRAVSLRPRRPTSQPESTGPVKDQNWVGRGHHPCEVQQHHPDLGRGAAGGEVTHHVLQWQDRKVIWFKLTKYYCRLCLWFMF